MGFCIGKNEKNWRIEGNFRDGEKIAFYKVHIEEPIVFESLHECPFNLTRLGLLSKSFSTYKNLLVHACIEYFILKIVYFKRKLFYVLRNYGFRISSKITIYYSVLYIVYIY